MKLFHRKAANKIAKSILEKFHLVMIAEQFDESMVLLAQCLCWPLDVVAGLQNNARIHSGKVAFKSSFYALIHIIMLG